MDRPINQQQCVENQLHEQHNNGSSRKFGIEDTQGKLFIGGLSWQTTESNLRNYFEKFGKISDVTMQMDKRSGKPR